MSDLIKIDTDTLEERLNCMDAEKDALEDRVKELEAVVETLQNEVEIQREEAQLPTEEASDMLAKFMTQDEIIELVNEILREATISIDV